MKTTGLDAGKQLFYLKMYEKILLEYSDFNFGSQFVALSLHLIPTENASFHEK